MGAVLPDVALLVQAGIDKKTGLPTKFESAKKCNLKQDIKHILRIVDEQDAINKGQWHNLPCNISSQELERMLYYRGQLAFFYIKELDSFYFMPYALDGTIDFYGRFNVIHPVPFANGTTKEEIAKTKPLRDYLSTLKLKCIYGVVDEEKVDEKMLTESCVLLHDYSKQLSQTITPRAELQDALIDMEAECLPMMRTNLIANCGVEGIRVQDADQQTEVNDANRRIEKSALSGEPYTAIVGTIDFQELTGANANKSEEFLMAMQSIDNIRLGVYGVENGGIFEKKAHMLNAEASVNSSDVSLIQQDYTNIRQNFCNIVNSIWDLGIWYEPSQNETGADVNGDGVLYDRNDGTNSQGVETNEPNAEDV